MDAATKESRIFLPVYQYSTRFVVTLSPLISISRIEKEEQKWYNSIHNGVSYNGSMLALGACGLGSIPSTPTEEKIECKLIEIKSSWRD